MLGHTAALARAAAAGGGPSRRTLVALSACAAAGALAGVECLKQGGRFSPMPLTGAPSPASILFEWVDALAIIAYFGISILAHGDTARATGLRIVCL